MNRLLLRNYQWAPNFVRMHIWSRLQLFPFTKLERFLPLEGTFIDIGCGYGQWPLLMGYIRPQADIYGYDPDETKIDRGKEAIDQSGLSNVHLGMGSGIDLPWMPCRLVTVIDVLYLIPFAEQEKILLKAFDHLEPGGRLLIKEMNDKPRWKYAWNWIEEWLAVRFLKITMGKRFYFRNQSEWETLLRRLGYLVETHRLDRGYLHPHVLFVGDKP